MIDPITIATLAANKFIESGAGEVSKKLVEKLWNVIAERFKGSEQKQKALETIAIQKNEASITSFAKYLDEEMRSSREFSTQVEQLAQQIINLSETNLQQTNNSFGHNQIIINSPTGDLSIG